MATETIHIEREENIQSVITRIVEAKASSLNLIVPNGARIFQSIVDANLLKEAAESNNKEVFVFTSDIMGRIFVERAGLRLAVMESGTAGAAASITTNPKKMSDIVPKSRVSFAALASKKTPFNFKGTSAANRAGYSKSKSPLEFFGRAAAGSSQSARPSPVKKAAGPSKKYSPASKGELGARFLKAYKEERAKTATFDELTRRRRKKFLGLPELTSFTFVGGIVVVALAAAFLVFGRTLPRADLVVYPARESKSTNLEVLITTKTEKADLVKGVIPGEILTLEKSESGEFPTSGLKDVSEKAKGRITVYNEFSSQNQTLIPSRFQSPDGKIFWSTKTVIIPGASVEDGQSKAGQISVDVVAAQAGEEYNIGPGRFTLPALKGSPKGEKIYAVSELPLSGGQSGQVAVVSGADAAGAYNTLKEKLRPQLQALRNSLPAGFQLWPEAYNEELADSSVRPEIGEPAETFKADIRMVARAVLFKSGDLDSYIDQQARRGLDEGKELLAGSKEVSFLKPPVIDYQQGTIFAALLVRFDIIDKLDGGVFKSEILKKNKNDIKKILGAHENIERVEIKFWPFWVRRVPANAERVNITINGL